jgi:regulator of replication initiation timing
MNAAGDGTDSPPHKRRQSSRTPGATTEVVSTRSTRSNLANSHSNSNQSGGALSDITPNVDASQAKRKRAVKLPPSSHHPRRAVTNSVDRTADTPLVPRALNPLVPCEGIGHDLDSKSLVLYLGTALRTKGNELIESARGDSDLNTVDTKLGSFLESNTDADLAPSFQGLVCRKLNEGVIIVSMECTLFATDTRTGEQLTERPTQGLARCNSCRRKADAGRKSIQRLCTSLDKETAAKFESVKSISQNPTKSNNEITSLRSKVSDLTLANTKMAEVEEESAALKLENERVKSKIEKAEMILQKQFNEEEKLGDLIILDGTAADYLVQIVSLIDKVIEEDLKQDGDENARIMWKIHLRHLLQLYAAGGNARKVKCVQLILDWSIVFLARTSKRIFNEVRKVMRLPSYSWVCKVSSERVSRTDSKAFSICIVTLSEMRKQSEAENWSSTTKCGFLAADAAAITEGLQWNYTSNKLEGSCELQKYQQVTNKFHKMANQMNGDANATLTAESSIYENVALAKEHGCVKWTSIDPEKDISEIVASVNCELFNADVVFSLTNSLFSTMPQYGLRALGISGDAANSNWRAFLNTADKSPAVYLSQDLMAKWPLINFELRILTEHPVTGDPFLFINDHMHLAKCNVNTLEKSSSPTSKRNLMYKKCPVNLRMIEIAWRATGGGTNQLQPTKLGDHCFKKGPRSRLDCPTAVQTLSSSTGRMIRAAIDDTTVTLEPYRNKKVFYPLVHYIERWDKLIDITNGRHEKYTPENGEEITEKLLEILSWFCKWKNSHDEDVKKQLKTEYNFFADTTWFGIQNLILGHVFVIQYWCIGQGMTIDPLALSTDPVEHHFGNCRQFVGGSTAGLTAQKMNQGDAKSRLAKKTNFDQVGNCRDAPKKGQTTTKDELPFKDRKERF